MCVGALQEHSFRYQLLLMCVGALQEHSFRYQLLLQYSIAVEPTIEIAI